MVSCRAFRLTMHSPSRESEREMEYVEFDVTPPSGTSDQAALAAFCQRIADALAPQTHHLHIPPLHIAYDGARGVQVIVGHRSLSAARSTGELLAATLRRKMFTVDGGLHPTNGPTDDMRVVRTAPLPAAKQEPGTGKPATLTSTGASGINYARPLDLPLVVMRTPPVLRHGPRNEAGCLAVFNELLTRDKPASNRELREKTGFSIDKVRTALHYLVADGLVTVWVERDGPGRPRYFYQLSPLAVQAGAYDTDDPSDQGKLWGNWAPGKLAVIAILVAAAQKDPVVALTIEEIDAQVGGTQYKAIWKVFTRAVSEGLLEAHKSIVGGYRVNAYQMTALGLKAGTSYLRRHSHRATTDER